MIDPSIGRTRTSRWPGPLAALLALTGCLVLSACTQPEDDDASQGDDDTTAGDDDTVTGDDDSGDDDSSTADADHDSYTTAAGDCDDADPAVYPGAIEWAIDGTDSNCDGVQDLTYALAGTLDRGDGGPATGAYLQVPQGLVRDTGGTLYIADSEDFRIRRVGIDGTITTVAGNGSENFGINGDTQTLEGDGGPATDAAISTPFGLALASDGTLFFSDWYGGMIRKVDPAGIITSVTGIPGGDTPDGGPASEATLHAPAGLALSAAGDLFVADSGANCVYRIDTEGILTRVAGTGEAGDAGEGGPARDAQLSYPLGVTLDLEGRLLIADTANSRLVRIEDDGTLIRIADASDTSSSGDGGPASDAALNGPYATAVDADGSIYISQWSAIRRIDPEGIITTVAGGGETLVLGEGAQATSVFLYPGAGIALEPGGTFLFSDHSNDRVRRVDAGGILSTVAGAGPGLYNGDEQPATSAMLEAPQGIAIDAAGAVYIADVRSFRVRKVDPDGTIHTVAGTGQPGFPADGGQATEQGLQPSDVAIDTSGALFICDRLTARVFKVNSSGVITTVAGGGSGTDDVGPATTAQLGSPGGIGLDGETLYIAETGNNRIRKVTAQGTISTVAGNGDYGLSGDGGPATSASLAAPLDMLVGADGTLFIADTENHRIRMIDASGIIQSLTYVAAYDATEEPRQDVTSPRCLAMDTGGNLFVSDTYGTISRIDLDEMILHVTGGDAGVIDPDGAPIYDSPIKQPYGLAFDAGGALMFADTELGMVLRVVP